VSEGLLYQMPVPDLTLPDDEQWDCVGPEIPGYSFTLERVIPGENGGFEALCQLFVNSTSLATSYPLASSSEVLILADATEVDTANRRAACVEATDDCGAGSYPLDRSSAAGPDTAGSLVQQQREAVDSDSMSAAIADTGGSGKGIANLESAGSQLKQEREPTVSQSGVCDETEHSTS
jgi:hypothetical protein